MEYRAVTKEDPAKDLTHWKYIKRVKKNGKWRYYYDATELKKYRTGANETKKAVTTVKNTNDLIGDEHTFNYNGVEYTVKNRGIIEQLMNNGVGDSVDKQTVITFYMKTDDLLSSSSSTVSGNTKNSTTYVFKKQGRIDRAIANAEKWIFDKFLNKRR